MDHRGRQEVAILSTWKEFYKAVQNASDIRNNWAHRNLIAVRYIKSDAVDGDSVCTLSSATVLSAKFLSSYYLLIIILIILTNPDIVPCTSRVLLMPILMSAFWDSALHREF